ncbi:uncharacterized protein LOC135370389 [Ornithodoros turicata]|uniref:uncharacterized protein LOC135370389 n=1 Tax=Ornithodoros turicata TaxID=34597 RepID=UPI0031391828
MDSVAVFEKDFVVESVLGFMDTEDIFNCCEVNHLWYAVGLSLLRKKLVSVPVCCASYTDPMTSCSPSCGHSCMDIFCKKFVRYRNIARMAGMRPTLVFLAYREDPVSDRRVVNALRGLLPADCVITYFKLELVRNPEGSSIVPHDGIIGEFIFRQDNGPWTPMSPALSYQYASPVDDDDDTTSRSGGAVFRNVLPGVLMFQALHVTDITPVRHAITSYFTEAFTRRTIQVTSVVIFSNMPQERLFPFMRSLRNSLGATTNTIAVVFPRNDDEALPELEAFQRLFPKVPVLANQATFHVDGQYAPISRLKLILLIIKLLE